MDFFKNLTKKKARKGIRKIQGKDEPYERPAEKEEDEETRPGMFSKTEMEEMNEARRKQAKRKRLKELSKK